MRNQPEVKEFIIDINGLPDQFPTHSHSPEFWEQLGRTIATFGFLEDMLGRAIYAFTATRTYDGDNADEAYQNWSKTLEHALKDQLPKLADSYKKAVREHQDEKVENIQEIVDAIKKVGKIRNVLCHGSWQPPDAAGKSLPRFVSNQLKRFDTKIDVAFLYQIQRHVAELACVVINSVTQMGWQFPGSKGPGKTI
jgi:hypothetical protein